MIRNELLSIVLLLLAALGLAAILLRLGLTVAEATAANGLAEVSQRRGDITGFLERQASSVILRRARRRNLAAVAGFALLLAIPPFAGVAREVYAAAALLWLLPRRPVRPTAPIGPTPPTDVTVG